MALLHIDQVKDFNDVPSFLQKFTHHAKQLAFTVQNEKRCVGLQQIDKRKESAFTGAGTTNYHSVQITAVLSAVQPHSHISGKNLVGFWILIPVLSIDRMGIAPPC